MKKTNFFKLLTLGVAALSLGFASCNYVKDADFQQLCKDVETLQNDVAGIKTQLADMDYVKSVVETPAGSGNWLVTPNKGTAVTIKTGSGETPTGEPNRAGTLAVDPTTGTWFIGTKDTGIKANATMPKIAFGTGDNADQAFWQFPVFEGEAVKWVPEAWTEETAVVAYTYAVHNTTTNLWTLWVPTKDDLTKLSAIELPGAASGLSKIDILGWVDGYALVDGEAKGNLSTNPRGDYYNAGVADDGNEVNGISGDTEHNGGVLAPGSVALWNTADDTFAVYYNWISNFYTDTKPISFGDNALYGNAGKDDATYGTNAALPYYGGFAASVPAGGFISGNRTTFAYPNIYTPGAKKADAYAWTSEKGKDGKQLGAIAVNRHDVLTTLDGDNKGLVIQVHPLTADISDETFVLEDSKGNVLPIKFQKPKLISGLLTRGTATNSGLWFVEGAASAGNFPKNTSATDNGRTDFAKAFTTNTVWSLVTPDGKRSEYTPFTFTPTYVVSRENQVDNIMNGAELAVLGEVPANATGTPDFAYAINSNQDITPQFEATMLRSSTGVAFPNANAKHGTETTDAPPFDIDAPTANGWDNAPYSVNTVIDWYMTVGSNQSNEQWITDNFGIVFDDTHKSFQVTRVPDDLTRASFWMDIYKLGIDGTIYLERLPFHVVRKEDFVTIPVTYTIQDEYPTQANDYLSQKFTVDLKPMFDKLQTIPDGPTNMRERWQDETYGAYTFTVAGLEIEEMEGDQLGRFMFPNKVQKTQIAVGNTPASSGTPGTAYGSAPVTGGAPLGAGGVGQNAAYFGPAAMGFVPKSTGAIAGLYDVTSFEFYPNYAYNTGTSVTGDNANTNQPSFVRGKKHTFTVHFYEQNGAYLNTIKIEVTPDIPVLNNLFKKDLERWNNKTSQEAATVLYAYYATPLGNWAGTKFYGTDIGTEDIWLTQTNSVGINSFGATEAIRRNSTFYNVFNPGGSNNMSHNEFHPLDGGYLKVANRYDTENPKQWIDNVSVALKNPNGEFATGKKYSDYLTTANTGTTIPAWAAINQHNGTTFSSGFTTNTIVQLYDQTNTNSKLTIPEESDWSGLPKTGTAYNQTIPMKWNLGQYIHFYTYNDTEMAKNDFSIRIMSAIEKEDLANPLEVPSKAGIFAGQTVQNKGSMVTTITKDNIYMKDYAGNTRQIFKEWIGGASVYGYNYIARVWFSRPNEVAHYDIIDPVTNAEQNMGSTATEAKNPTNTDPGLAYLPIMTRNLAQDTVTKIHVTVNDRFGRTMEQDVEFTISAPVAQP